MSKPEIGWRECPNCGTRHTCSMEFAKATPALPDGAVAWRKAVANEIRRVAGRDLSAAQCDNLAGAVIALYAFPHPESGDVRENLTMEEFAQVLAVPDADEIEKLRSQLGNAQSALQFARQRAVVGCDEEMLALIDSALSDELEC